jgi:rhamnosyl/mannosyltransferase
MRVLQLGKFYYPYMGGIENHLYHLSQGLRDHVDVEVLVANDSTETVTEKHEGIKVTRIGAKVHFASTQFCPGLTRRLSESEYDVIHAHLPNPMGVLAYLASRKRGSLVVTYHSDIVRQRFLRRLYQPFQLSFLRKARAIIATSPNYIATSPVLAHYREKCVPIPYGIDPDLGVASDRDNVRKIRERYGPRILLACGRLVYYKGFECLIDAMRELDATLLIVGTGPLESSLLRQVRDSGLEGKVFLLGEIKNWDMKDYYAACDVFVLPSVTRSEAFAIVQLEAMAFGKPVVNTALDSGVPYVSKHGESGLTVPPRDALALRGAIRELLSNEELRRQLGEGGRARFKREFIQQVMIDRILNVYREITGDRRPSAPRS